MTAVVAPILSICLAFVIVGVIRKIYVDTGEMVLLEHLKDDWTYRLPFRLRNNRYRGLSRPSYQLLAILYYIVKAIIILALCAYYYVLVGFLIAMKWIWNEIRCAGESKTTCIEQEDHLDTKLNDRKIDRSPCSDAANKHPSSNAEPTAFAYSPAATGKNTISSLWNYGSEIAWHVALDYYHELLNEEEQVLDCYMEAIDADEIAQLSAAEFYDFLYHKYFVWKYTAKNRLATTRKSLKRYVDENKLHELANIQQRLFSSDHANIEKCLTIAAEIRGLGPAGASGLLAVLFPESFGTIDQYVVKALKEVDGLPYASELAKMNPDSLSIENGVLLIRIMREQAEMLNKKFNTTFWTPRNVDMVLWAIGRVRK